MLKIKFLNDLFIPIKGIIPLGETHIMYQLLHKLYNYYCLFVIVGPIFKTINILLNSACVGIFTSTINSHVYLNFSL